MRIAVHDFAGHPFQVQLSRELASRGHSVMHLYLQELPGPKGPLERAPGDPPAFLPAPVCLGAPFEKYSMRKRHFAHRRYARALISLAQSYRPDVILSANTPIDVQYALVQESRRRGIGFVHWMQDLYCLAVRSVLTRKLGAAGVLLAWHYDRLERRVCEDSDAVVAVTPDFLAAIGAMGFRPARSYVVENWAPLDSLPPAPKRNPWSVRHRLSDKLVFLYSGTLGLKHKPESLYRLAEALDDVAGAAVVVVSEGLGRTWLERETGRRPLKNLILMDFQPYACLPEVLGAADVLLAVIEQQAGDFAVPSKVLSYYCAGRPVLLAAPSSNLAARTLIRAHAGIHVSPDDVDGFVAAALRLASDRALRQRCGENARRYALSAFDIHAIGGRFESILQEAAEAAAQRHPSPAALPQVSPV